MYIHTHTHMHGYSEYVTARRWLSAASRPASYSRRRLLHETRTAYPVHPPLNVMYEIIDHRDDEPTSWGLHKLLQSECLVARYIYIYTYICIEREM